MSDAMRCWPTEWIDAAVFSGLASRTEFGMTVDGGDEQRRRLEAFASEIWRIAYNGALSDVAIEIRETFRGRFVTDSACNVTARDIENMREGINDHVAMRGH